MVGAVDAEAEDGETDLSGHSADEAGYINSAEKDYNNTTQDSEHDAAPAAATNGHRTYQRHGSKRKSRIGVRSKPKKAKYQLDSAKNRNIRRQSAVTKSRSTRLRNQGGMGMYYEEDSDVESLSTDESVSPVYRPRRR